MSYTFEGTNMIRLYHFIYSLILFFSASFLFSSQLEAQFVCTGAVCSYITSDIQSELDRTANQIEYSYLPEILKNNTEATFMNQIVSNSVGVGNVKRFQIGFGLGIAGVKKDDVVIQTSEVTLPKLPNGGLSINPTVNLDFNVGWLLGMKSNSIFSRFTVYLHGMDINVSEGDAKGLSAAKENLRLQGNMKSMGGMIRYQVLDPVTFGYSLFTWTGLNFGAGYHYSKQNYAIQSQNEKAEEFKLSSFDASWGGDTTFNYSTETKTYNADIRTGINVFWILTLYGGGGYTWNNGISSIRLQRNGPFVIKTGGLQDSNIPREYQQYFNQDGSIQQAGTLSLTSSATGNSKRSISYGIAGLELDFFLLKLTMEAIYGEKEIYGGSLAVKYSF